MNSPASANDANWGNRSPVEAVRSTICRLTTCVAVSDNVTMSLFLVPWPYSLCVSTEYKQKSIRELEMGGSGEPK